MNKGIVIVISGPSGSGKGTVVEQLRKIYPNAGVSVSAHRQDRREPAKLNGVHYHYKSRERLRSSSKAEKSLSIQHITAIITAHSARKPKK